MHIGQNCKVRWQTEQNSDVFIWHNAMIKSIEGDTITVIWEKGQWEGHESDRIPLDWVRVRDDMTSLKNDVTFIKNRLERFRSPDECMKEIIHMQASMKKENINHTNIAITELKKVTDLLTEKLDGINMRLDKLNDNLERAHTMGGLFDDEVNYDITKLKSSLESLSSVHMYSSGSVNMEDSCGKKKKYFSTPELGDLYSKEKLNRYNNNH